jgi:hypothetical protein
MSDAMVNDAPARQSSLNRVAVSATAHCLAGCSIGEILGMVIGNAAGWNNWATVTLSVVLAFLCGYALTLRPLLRVGIALRTALGLALASDTLSITVMEVIDNALMLMIPGAMEAGVFEPLFWGSMVVSLVLAGLGAFPINRWLIARGRGHALVHQHSGHHPCQASSAQETEAQPRRDASMHVHHRMM